MKIIANAAMAAILLSVIAGAYMAGGGSFPPQTRQSSYHRAMREQALEDFDLMGSTPTKTIAEDQEFAAFKEDIESGLKSLENADKSIQVKIDALAAEVAAANSGLGELKKRIEPILNPPQKNAEPVFERELSPMEMERLAGVFSPLPARLQSKQYGMTVESAKDLVESGGMRELMQAFAVLASQGENVRLCVGSSTMGAAPAWLELENKGLWVVCKGLSLEGYSGLKGRSTLPDMLKQPAYILEYRNMELRYFGACEVYRLKNY